MAAIATVIVLALAMTGCSDLAHLSNANESHQYRIPHRSLPLRSPWAGSCAPSCGRWT